MPDAVEGAALGPKMLPGRRAPRDEFRSRVCGVQRRVFRATKRTQQRPHSNPQLSPAHSFQGLADLIDAQGGKLDIWNCDEAFATPTKTHGCWGDLELEKPIACSNVELLSSAQAERQPERLRHDNPAGSIDGCLHGI